MEKTAKEFGSLLDNPSSKAKPHLPTNCQLLNRAVVTSVLEHPIMVTLYGADGHGYAVELGPREALNLAVKLLDGVQERVR